MIGQKGFKKWFWIALFLLPSLAGLVTFLLIPMLASLGLTLLNWDPLLPSQFNFVGFKNFIDLSKDTLFWKAFQHTLAFIAGYIPCVLITGLSAALLMNQKLKFLSFFRGAFFMPVISAWVAVSVIWAWILNPQYGLVNYFLGLIGIQGTGLVVRPPMGHDRNHHHLGLERHRLRDDLLPGRPAEHFA